MRVAGAQGSAWVRQIAPDEGGGVFLFAASRRVETLTLEVTLDLRTLGLSANDTLRIEDCLGGALIHEARPADELLLDPLRVPLPRYGTAVWRLTPTPKA